MVVLSRVRRAGRADRLLGCFLNEFFLGIEYGVEHSNFPFVKSCISSFLAIQSYLNISSVGFL